MDTKKTNWSLTLIFCLIFGALGFIGGKMSDCGKSSSCEAPRQSCSAHHVGESHHGDKHAKKKCCAEGKKCKKHTGHEKEVEVEVEEIISED